MKLFPGNCNWDLDPRAPPLECVCLMRLPSSRFELRNLGKINVALAKRKKKQKKPPTVSDVDKVFHVERVCMQI